MKTTSPLLSLLLVPLLVIRPLPAFQLPDTSNLEIHAIENDGASIAPGSISPRGFSIQVTDGTGSAVADAAVVIRFPETGATATFADGSHSIVAYTDAGGKAQVSGIHWSAEPGTVPVRITATKGAAHAGTLFEEVLSVNVRSTVDAQAIEESKHRQPAPSAGPTQTKEPQQAATMQPATLAPPATVTVQTAESASPDRPSRLTLPPSGLTDAPSVTVVNRRPNEKFDGGSGGHKKWIILLVVVAAGAGAGFAFAGKKSSSATSTTSSSSGLSIGAPSINVGTP